MNYRKCLVLGGRGFLGSHIAEALLAENMNVRILDRPAPAGVRSLTFGGDGSFELFEGDFTNSQDVSAAVEGCDVCVHAVTTTLPKNSNDNIEFDILTNLLGTIRLLEHASKSGMKKIIFLSSGGTIYGTPTTHDLTESHPTDPISSYGITKLAIEKYLRLFEHLNGLTSISLRISNPFGPRQKIDGAQGAVAVFLGAALRGNTIAIWGDGSIVRDYVHVDDVVSAVGAALGYEGKERVFNIGSGRGRSLLDVISAVESATGARLEKVFSPSRLFDVQRNVLDITRAQRELHWSPKVSFADGVQSTAIWLLEELQRENLSTSKSIGKTSF